MEKYAVLQSSSHLKMVWIERKIMSLSNSQFLVNLIYAFQSPTELFLVMPFMQGKITWFNTLINKQLNGFDSHTNCIVWYCLCFWLGGDLRFHLKERGTMPVDTCRFYAAEMIMGLVNI